MMADANGSQSMDRKILPEEQSNTNSGSSSPDPQDTEVKRTEEQVEMDTEFQKTKEEQKRLEQTYKDLLKTKPYHQYKITEKSWKIWKWLAKDPLVKDCTVSLWKYENYEISRVEWKTKLNIGKFEVKDENDKVVSSGTLQMSSNTMSFIMENLQLGKKYLVEITNRDAESSNPDAAFYISTCPTLPTNIKIDESDSGAICTWDPCEGAERYEVEIDEGKKYLGKGNVATIPKRDYKIGRRYKIRVEAIGKQKEQKTISEWTDFVTGGVLVPTNLKAIQNPDNPYRSILITWENPDTDKECTGYECSIIPSSQIHSSSAVDKPETVARDARNCTFTQLKSGTEYIGNVVAIFVDGQRSTICQSSICKTKKASRDQNEKQKLQQQGKVTNVKLTPLSAPDEVRYEVTWENGDIGNLSKHFVLSHTTLDISNTFQNKKEQSILVKPDDENKAIFSLKRGGKYTMSIIAFYRDLDKEITESVRHEQDIYTDIEKPDITMAECNKGKITIRWEPVVGAKNYDIKVLDTHTRETLHSAPSLTTDIKYEFDVIRECGYGKTCKFQVTATAYNGKKKTADHYMIIGGDDVPTRVIAATDPSLSHRKIKVSWNAPSNNQAIKYDVVLIQGNAEIEKQSTDSTSVIFTELTSDAMYCAYVTAINTENVRSEKCYSKNVRTTGKPKAKDSSTTKPSKEFGAPMNLECVVGNSEDHLVANLKWNRPRLGVDYKFSRYKITTLPCSKPPQTFYVYDSLESVKYELPLPKHGIEYTVTVFTEFIEIDKKKIHEQKADVMFFAGISQPVINDPECLSENEVKFHWTASPGATEYMVEINDKSNNEPCESTKIKENSLTTVNHDKLFIGRSYIIKVTAQRNKEMTSLQAVKEVFLGGDKVPRHILPAKDVDDPWRTVYIQFDKPMTDARLKEYEVRAIPSSGRIRRTTTCQNTAVKIKYLQSNTKYRIEVTAVNEAGEKSLPSSSIWFKTDEKLSTTKAPSMMTMSDSTGSLNLQGALLTQQNITGPSAAISDTVFDIRCEVTAETDNTDKVLISWEPPSFNQHPEDYRIMGYIVELLDAHGNSLIHNPKKDERKAEFKNLKCGKKKYKASVKTIYEDIDADTDAITSKANTEDLYTRPTKPNISKNSPNDQDEKLEVEWNASEGANEYILEIFKDGVDETQIKNIIKAPKNKWSCSFSEKIGFGSRYKIRLTATVTEGKSNSDETDYQIIGGDQVPKNSRASKNIENPNTKADISWDKPNSEPLHYLVEAYNGQVCEQTSVEVKGTQHTMSQLKPGTKYGFKVFAVYESMTAAEGTKKSGGCLTNTITTKAAPSKIGKLDVILSKENPSTSASMNWEADKQVGTSENQLIATKFQISLVCINKKRFYQEMLTEDKQFQLNGLEPGYTYEVSVTGGNDDGGFGEKSDSKQFITKLGIPHDLRLMVNKDKPSSSVILYFAKVEGMPSGYRAILCNGQVVVAEKLLIPEKTTVKFDENIGGNTKYYAEVQALYDIENEPSSKCGEKVKSNSVITAPPKSEPPHVELIKENDKYKSGWIKITWDPPERCNIHEVEIRKEGSEVEKTLVVEQKFCEYQCKEEGNKYRVRMRSQNPSGYYGEWSEYATEQLAPADLQHVNAVAEDDEIVVKWAKPVLETEFIVQVYVDGNPYGEPVERIECRYAVAMNSGISSSTYSFAVCAKIDELQGNMVKSNDVISKPSPGILTSIAHPKTGKCNQIQVSWRKHSKCDFYQVEIKRKSFYQPENILTVKSEVEENGDEQSCTYLCQSPGGIYAFRVRCQYKSVLGDWSEEKLLQLAPPKVTLTESKMEKNVLSLKWKALEIPLEWYIIKVYCNGEYMYELKTKAKKNGTQIKNLCPGKKYYCEISAKNAAGEGKCTKTQEHKTYLSKAFLMSEMDRNNPSEVALLKWKIPEGVNCFKLIIQDKNLKKDEILFPAEIKEDKAPLKDDVKEERFSQYLFNRGIPGSEYEIRLHCGYDGEYDDNCTISKLTMAPASPVNLTVSRNEFQPSTSILVKIQDEVNFKKMYRIVAQPHSSREYEVFVNTSRCNMQLFGLTSGETYDVYVVCRIGDLCSPPFFSLPIQTVPCKVVGVNIGIKKKEVRCFWKELDIKPENYVIQLWHTGHMTFSTSTTDAEFIDRNLLPAKEYSFRVAASNRSGQGEWSDMKLFETEPSRGQLTDIASGESGKCNEIQASWKKHLKCDFYQVEIKRKGLNQPENILTVESEDVENGDEQSCTYLCLSLGDIYAFRVRCHYSELFGDWSEEKFFQLVPAKVTGLDIKKVKNEVTCFWNVPDVIPVNYFIQFWQEGRLIQSSSTNGTEFIKTDLPPAGKYSIRAAASNSIGQGEWSDFKLFNTAPVPPSNIKVTHNPENPQTSIVVSFEDEKNLSKRYKIWVLDGVKIFKEVETTKHRTTVNDLEIGYKYNIKVAAIFEGMSSEDY